MVNSEAAFSELTFECGRNHQVVEFEEVEVREDVPRIRRYQCPICGIDRWMKLNHDGSFTATNDEPIE